MAPTNPYASPESSPHPGLKSLSGSGGLGSLAQSAREKEIGQARWILILVGVLTLGLNAFLLYNATNEVEQVIRENAIDPAELDSYRTNLLGFCYLVYGGACALGITYIILGLIVKKFPVPVTILGLVLYVLSTLGFALLDPMSLAKGIIVKIFIVIGLVKAIKAALAYEKDTKLADADEAFLA